MDYLKEILSHHASQAHWYLFGAIMLAGFNVPISADLLVFLAALIAATIVPEQMWVIFWFLLIGCYLSAMCAYWMGRLLGSRLSTSPWFQKLLPAKRLSRIQHYYERYGLLTLICGRFIPFGVRNCVFMTSGISRFSFKKFALMDALACVLWYSVYFYLFFTLSQHADAVWQAIKTFNLFLFAAFGVTVIGVIWYKRSKKGREKDPQPAAPDPYVEE